MSKQKGLIKLEGTLGGIAFYQSDGQHLARIANGPSKERIMTDANFVRTRENNKEFGGASTVSKALRLAFATSLVTMSDGRVGSRLTSVFRDMCSKDSASIRGQRSFLLTEYGYMLENTEFNIGASVTASFNAPFTVSHNAARNSATISVPAFVPSVYVHAPSGATHFKLTHAIGVVSDYLYDDGSAEYEPADNTLNLIGAVAQTDATAINSSVPVNFDIDVNLPGAPVMSDDVSVIQALGIEFFQRVGTVDYNLFQGSAMKIVKVF